jgi:hypothetical protein
MASGLAFFSFLFFSHLQQVPAQPFVLSPPEKMHSTQGSIPRHQ